MPKRGLSAQERAVRVAKAYLGATTQGLKADPSSQQRHPAGEDGVNLVENEPVKLRYDAAYDKLMQEDTQVEVDKGSSEPVLPW